jgi:stage II sporulation SpoAA-like protein
MVEQLDALPAGVLGFRISGRLSRDDYRGMMGPIHEAVDRAEKLNLLFLFDDDFHGADLGGLCEDVKAAGSIGLGHRSAWERMALVTDKDWIRHGVSGFGWLSPGELRLFESGERDAALAWVAGAA